MVWHEVWVVRDVTESVSMVSWSVLRRVYVRVYVHGCKVGLCTVLFAYVFYVSVCACASWVGAG